MSLTPSTGAVDFEAPRFSASLHTACSTTIASASAASGSISSSSSAAGGGSAPLTFSADLSTSMAVPFSALASSCIGTSSCPATLPTAASNFALLTAAFTSATAGSTASISTAASVASGSGAASVASGCVLSADASGGDASGGDASGGDPSGGDASGFSSPSPSSIAPTTPASSSTPSSSASKSTTSSADRWVSKGTLSKSKLSCVPRLSRSTESIVSTVLRRANDPPSLEPSIARAKASFPSAVASRRSLSFLSAARNSFASSQSPFCSKNATISSAVRPTFPRGWSGSSGNCSDSCFAAPCASMRTFSSVSDLIPERLSLAVRSLARFSTSFPLVCFFCALKDQQAKVDERIHLGRVAT
mmetsp:Transcript_125323/g.313109  ORF Transcript_125323/g.313109 Transcript_125323/m.313109 type:complete len:361 (-) Transcript_125323:3627-4709(-)